MLTGFAIVCMAIFCAAVAKGAAQDAENSKTVVFGMNWEPVGFYPLRAVDSASYYGQTLVYEGLVSYGADTDIVPGLAERFEIAPDGPDL